MIPEEDWRVSTGYHDKAIKRIRSKGELSLIDRRKLKSVEDEVGDLPEFFNRYGIDPRAAA